MPISLSGEIPTTILKLHVSCRTVSIEQREQAGQMMILLKCKCTCGRIIPLEFQYIKILIH